MVANEGEVSEGVQKLEIDPSDRKPGTSVLMRHFMFFLLGLISPTRHLCRGPIYLDEKIYLLCV